MPRTVAELVVARSGDQRTALWFEEQSWTWAEVVNESAARAEWLRTTLDPDRPPHVGVLLENVPDFVFILFGAALAGATVVGINPTRRGAELRTDIEHTDCQLVFTDEAGSALLPADLPCPVVPDGPEQGGTRLVLGHPDGLPPPETLWVLLFTSGSSGRPKAVRGTQGRYGRAGAWGGFGPTDVLYSAMPLFHGNALSANLLPATAGGSTIILKRKFSARDVLPDVRRHGVTFFNSVGRALGYILATPPSDVDRDHQLRLVMAPEASPADIKAFEERFGCRIYTGYGQSEGAIVILPTADPAALGTAAPGMDLAVVDPDTGEECPPARFDENGALVNGDEAIGEIVRRDAGAADRFEGYYANPEADAERRKGGWYWSGDLAYRTEDGTFFFAGRSGDWLRVDSENFAAAPVERILGEFEPCAAVAVYGVPDPQSGDQVMAALELREGLEFDSRAFAEFLADHPDLGTKWAPRFVRITATLPITGPGKLNKQPLRAEAWRTDDPIWWRPPRTEDFRLFTAADAAELERQFAAHRQAKQ